jgi:hypothetical protein
MENLELHVFLRPPFKGRSGPAFSGTSRALAEQDKNGAWWLEAKYYDKDEFRDAWHPLLPEVVEEKEAQREWRPIQNEVRRPKADNLCDRARAVFEELSQEGDDRVSIRQSLEIAKARGLNEGNVRSEFYLWRKFNGISGRFA